jgi:hypothetical protein
VPTIVSGGPLADLVDHLVDRLDGHLDDHDHA